MYDIFFYSILTIKTKKTNDLIKSLFKYSIKFIFNIINHFSIKNKKIKKMIFCSFANLLYVRDLLRILQTNCIFFEICCMFVWRVVCSSNSKFVKFLIRKFANFFVDIFTYVLIFDKIEFIQIHCSNCILCKIVFSLRCIRTNISKTHFWL